MGCVSANHVYYMLSFLIKYNYILLIFLSSNRHVCPFYSLANRCLGSTFISNEPRKTKHNHFTMTSKHVEGFSHEDCILSPLCVFLFGGLPVSHVVYDGN